MRIVSVYSLKAIDLFNRLDSPTCSLLSVPLRPFIFGDVWFHLIDDSRILLFFSLIVCWEQVKVIGEVLVFFASFIDQIVLVYLDLSHLFGVSDLDSLEDLSLYFFVLPVKF